MNADGFFGMKSRFTLREGWFGFEGQGDRLVVTRHK